MVCHKISQLFRNAEKASSIVMNTIAPIKTEKEVLRDVHSQPKLVMLDCGAPAEHKMVAQMLEHPRKKEADKLEKEKTIQLETQYGATQRKNKEAQKVQLQEHKIAQQAERVEQWAKKHSQKVCQRIIKGAVRGVKQK